MTPRQASQSATAWWARLSDVEKAVHAALAIATLTVAGWVMLTGFLALPDRVGAVESRVQRLEASQDRTSRGVEFLVCRDQRREASLPLDYCDPYWNAPSFLPPARKP